MSSLESFNAYRQKMNDRILSHDNKTIKRFFNLDTNTYMEGALDVKTKEMMGLACSLVLRCDDCVKYHIIKCSELKVSEDELFEILNLSTIIGGSIVIPHMRRAVEFWDELKENH